MDSFKDKAKQTLNNWKSSIEELNVQLHLGAAEAQDEYEKQRKNLGAWVEENEKRVDEMLTEGREELRDLRTKLDELRVQAALGKAETRDAMEEQEKILHLKLHEIKHEANQIYDSTSDSTKEVLDNVQSKAEDFQTRFELFNLQMHLAAADASDVWDEKKKELSQKLHELKQKTDEVKEDAGDKWDNFSKEMDNSWQHFRKAFTTN